MAVLNLKRTPRELGRIRMGCKGDKGQPTRLEAFRLTSQDPSLIRAAAARYGGIPQPWQANPGHWEVYTTAAEIPCMVPDQDLSQWYELWSAGGCQRRCDGETCTVARAENVETTDCLCNPEKRDCQLTTRLVVILHQLPGVGVWRLETGGYYAATELPSAVELLTGLRQRGTYPPASLTIEQRTVKRAGKTKRFPVPALRIGTPLGTLMTGEVYDAPALPAPAPQLTARATPKKPLPGSATANDGENSGATAAANGATQCPECGGVAGRHSGLCTRGVIDNGGCPHCHAPQGKPHGKACPATIR